ncbi:putative ent-copalyl diphosphate synthase [Helianthus annuus]|nr:putative ent-copalyl diphosphate synthase [Helianthus annuus]
MLYQRNLINFYVCRWYHKSGIEKFETSNITSLLVSYYLAAASIFEPERSAERIAWTKTDILVHTISSYFDSSQLSNEDRTAFLDEFKNRSSFKQHFKYSFFLFKSVSCQFNVVKLLATI